MAFPVSIHRSAPLADRASTVNSASFHRRKQHFPARVPSRGFTYGFSAEDKLIASRFAKTGVKLQA
jgi:hypothetical protein